jgi:hypothetical protein
MDLSRLCGEAVQVNRAEFLAKLKRCKPGVELHNARLEGSDCFIFKKGRVHSYNGYISVSVPIEYDFDCVVAADELLHIVSNFKGKDIDIELKESALHLSSGKAKATINLMSETIYKQILSVIPGVPSWKKLPNGFLEALSDCKLTNLMGIAMQKLDGVFVDPSGIYSTDQVVINISKLYEDMDRLWLSSKMVTELTKFPTLEYYTLQDSWAIFKTDDIIFACRRYVDDKYPIEQLKQVILKHKTDGMRGNLPEGFRDLISNAVIMGSKKEERVFINLEFQKDGIQVFSDKHTGSYSEFIECLVENWEHLTISIDGDRLKQALRNHSDAEFHIGYSADGPNALILHKGGWTEFFFFYKR